MIIKDNLTPGQLLNAIRELEIKVSQPVATFSNAELAASPLSVRTNTSLLKQCPLKNGDTYLLTFYLVGGVKRDCNLSFIYVVNDTPLYLNELISEPSLYIFKDYDGAEHRLEVYIDLSNGMLKADTSCSNLWLVRAGVMPSFGKLGDIYN